MAQALNILIKVINADGRIQVLSGEDFRQIPLHEFDPVQIQILDKQSFEVPEEFGFKRKDDAIEIYDETCLATSADPVLVLEGFYQFEGLTLVTEITDGEVVQTYKEGDEIESGIGSCFDSPAYQQEQVASSSATNSSGSVASTSASSGAAAEAGAATAVAGVTAGGPLLGLAPLAWAGIGTAAVGAAAATAVAVSGGGGGSSGGGSGSSPDDTPPVNNAPNILAAWNTSQLDLETYLRNEYDLSDGDVVSIDDAQLVQGQGILSNDGGTWVFTPQFDGEAEGDFDLTIDWNLNGQPQDSTETLSFDLTSDVLNAFRENTQKSPDTAILTNGNMIAVWEGQGDTSSDVQSIWVQQFDENGDPLYLNGQGLQSDRLVNQAVGEEEFIPQVTALSDGGYAVVWQQGEGAGSKIFVQRFDVDGLAQFDQDIEVSEGISGTYTWNQSPKLIEGLNGGVALVWEGSQDGTLTEILLQEINPLGELATLDPVVVHSPASTSYSNPDITGIDTGNDGEINGYLVTWDARDLGADPLQGGYAATRYIGGSFNEGGHLDKLFDARGDTTPINLRVVGLENGEFMVFWTEALTGDVDSVQNVWGARFDLDGTVLTAPFAVNTLNATEDGFVHLVQDVALLPSGHLAVSWSTVDTGSNGDADIFVQVVDQDGDLQYVNGANAPEERRVHDASDEDQLGGNLAAKGDGSFVVTWWNGPDIHAAILDLLGEILPIRVPLSADDPFELDEDDVVVDLGDGDQVYVFPDSIFVEGFGEIILSDVGEKAFDVSDYLGADATVLDSDISSQALTPVAIVALTGNHLFLLDAVLSGDSETTLEQALEDYLLTQDDLPPNSHQVVVFESSDTDGLWMAYVSNVGSLEINVVAVVLSESGDIVFDSDQFDLPVVEVDNSAPNAAPIQTGEIDLGFMETGSGDERIILVSELLEYIEDPDNDELSISNLTYAYSGDQGKTEGIEWLGDRSGFVFTPEGFESGKYTFSYEVEDGEGGVLEAEAHLTLYPDGTLIIGTENQDTLLGNALDNIVIGLDDDDVLISDRTLPLLPKRGNDTLEGGAGNDTYQVHYHLDFKDPDPEQRVYIRFDEGDGNDTIEGSYGQHYSYQEEVLQFGPGIDPNSLVFSELEDDLKIESGADSVLVKDFFRWSEHKVLLDHIEFLDEGENVVSTMSIADIKSKVPDPAPAPPDFDEAPPSGGGADDDDDLDHDEGDVLFTSYSDNDAGSPAPAEFGLPEQPSNLTVGGLEEIT